MLRKNWTITRAKVSLQLRYRRLRKRAHRSRQNPTPGAVSTTSSFAFKIAERRRFVDTALVAGFDYTSPTKLEEKGSAKHLVESYGVGVPHTIAVFAADSIPWGQLPERFVLKPLLGAGSKGVFPLVRQSDGGFLNLLEGLQYNQDQVSQELRRYSDKNCGVICEELIEGSSTNSLPYDWKVYAFYGKVGLILQRSVIGAGGVSQSRVKYYNNDWDSLGGIRSRSKYDPDLPLPKNGDEILRVAAKLSQAITCPFVRVDLYENPLGQVVFGEFTSSPGGPQVFDPVIDRVLGTMWEDAEARLRLQDGSLGAWVAATL